MNLRSPQPNQTFFHVGPEGNSYTSDGSGLITPLTPADEASLRALGCVDVVEEVEAARPKVKAPVDIEDVDDDLA